MPVHFQQDLRIRARIEPFLGVLVGRSIVDVGMIDTRIDAELILKSTSSSKKTAATKAKMHGVSIATPATMFATP
jgi:hypothetical protein